MVTVQTCPECSTAFARRSGKVYCSRICKDRASGRRPRASRGTSLCVVCGAWFIPRRGSSGKCCGRDCGLEWQAFQRRVKATGGRVYVRVRRQKAAGGPSKWYVPVLHAECRTCGTEFNRSDGGSTRFFCSKRCKDEKEKLTRKAARNSPAVKMARRIDKKMRRALSRGANGGERVDPLKVFERDGWRCGLCGSMTLKSARGSTHDRAPELDHIIPLALGGAHSYANTQCACRRCNGAKGATARGQLRLF